MLLSKVMQYSIHNASKKMFYAYYYLPVFLTSVRQESLLSTLSSVILTLSSTIEFITRAGLGSGQQLGLHRSHLFVFEIKISSQVPLLGMRKLKISLRGCENSKMLSYNLDKHIRNLKLHDFLSQKSVLFIFV